jgi:hypothetical protein
LSETDFKSTAISVLRHIIGVSLAKFNCEGARNRDRQAWGRLIIQAIEPAVKVQELDMLEERILKIEEELKRRANQ